eukprot:jgi/Chrzof1/116/Cz01g03310.t1
MDQVLALLGKRSADGSPDASPRTGVPPERCDSAYVKLLREQFWQILADRDAAHAAELQKVRQECDERVAALEKEKQTALQQLAQAQRERDEAVVLADRVASQCELLDRRSRSKNVMLYNHAVANKDIVKSVIVQKAHLSASDVVDVVAAAPKQPVPGKEYPFKVVLATRAAVFDVLRAQASLRKEQRWRVDVDLTPQQHDLRRSKLAQFNSLQAAGARVFFKATDLFVRKTDGTVVPAAEWIPEPVPDARPAAAAEARVGTATVAAGPSSLPAIATTLDCVSIEPSGTDIVILRIAQLNLSFLSLWAPIIESPLDLLLLGVSSFLGLFHCLYCLWLLLLTWVLCYYAWCSKSRMRLGCPLWHLHLKM